MVATAVRRVVARRWHWLVGGVVAGCLVLVLSPHIPGAMAWLGERPLPLVVVLPALVLLWPLAIGEALAELTPAVLDPVVRLASPAICTVLAARGAGAVANHVVAALGTDGEHMVEHLRRMAAAEAVMAPQPVERLPAERERNLRLRGIISLAGRALEAAGLLIGAAILWHYAAAGGQMWETAPDLLAALGTILVGMCCWYSAVGLLRAMTSFAGAAAALILLRWVMWTFHPEAVQVLSREQALEWHRWQKLQRCPLGGALLAFIWGGRRAVQTLDRLADDRLQEVRA